MIFFMLLVLLLLNYYRFYADHEPIVLIPSLGYIRGSYMNSTAGRKFASFRGIPYAKPPVGEFRFKWITSRSCALDVGFVVSKMISFAPKKDPVAVDPWENVILDGTREGPSCEVEEDCLKLNVYTHFKAKPGKDLKPVMVWIHGGSFSVGSGNGESDLYGPGYLLNRDIVLVTINYRLGPLGFMSTGDAEAPGNYGLLDQSLALNWIREHIRHFGGDPKSVTIFGHSAGGASVEYHILSPRSKGLFDRAIVQSGSAFCPWATRQTGNVWYTKLLAKNLNCPLSSQEMLSCLRGKEFIEFTNFTETEGTVMSHKIPFTLFSPRVDVEREHPFLPDDPKKLISGKRFNSVPLITGITENEGAIFAAVLAGDDGKALQEFKSDPIRFIPYILGFELRGDSRHIAQKIYNKYFSNDPTENGQLKAFTQMISDYCMNKCVDKSVQLISQNSDQPTFYYNYAHRNPFKFESYFGAPHGFDQGVGHYSEVFMMFTNSLAPVLSAPDDIRISEMLLDLWTSFAAKGIPQSPLMQVEWLPTNRQDGSSCYLRINSNSTEMINGSTPLHHRIHWVDHIFDDVLRNS